MSSHLIVTCRKCGAEWDMDFEPESCTCDDDHDDYDLTETEKDL